MHTIILEDLKKAIHHLSLSFSPYNVEAKTEVERSGYQIVPNNFYSVVPSVELVNSGWERRAQFPFYDEHIYNQRTSLRYLYLLSKYSKEFSAPLDQTREGEFFWNNTQYSFSDALSLYCFIRLIKPKKVIEIGGGFSTLIIDQALKKNGAGEIWEIEPYPRPFLKEVDTITHFYEQDAQSVDTSVFDELGKRDILFIDSTHTIKESSDCTHIYLKVIPKIKSGVYIHIHDIFLPGILPAKWHNELCIHWNEMYVVQAMLALSDQYRFIYGSAYHNNFNKTQMAAFIQDVCTSSKGGSLWIYKR